MDTWEKIVPPFRYDKETPFFDMLVPTVDTVRFGYILEKLLSVRRSVLYTGSTGVGKVRARWHLPVAAGLLPGCLFVCVCPFQALRLWDECSTLGTMQPAV